MRKLIVVVIAALISACTVRQEDLDAWVGVPVSELEKHPFFITVPVVKTVTSDGTEIWNYVNGRNIGGCWGSGYGNINTNGYLNTVNYNQFSNCVSNFAACNNIFYIKDGYVERYVPTGSGGMRCYTTEELQPGFRGSANLR